MTDTIPLQPIYDPEEIKNLGALIADVVDSPGHLKLDWLAQNHWVAVPVESAAHFDEDQAATLANALQTIGCTECFAIATEPLRELPLGYRVQTTEEGLLTFSRECSHFNFVLIPGNKAFAILCTVDDYFIVAGPQEFVRQAIRGDIEAARARFEEFASDEWWENRLLAVSRRYKELFGSTLYAGYAHR